MKQQTVGVGFQEVDEKYLPEFSIKSENGKYEPVIIKIVAWAEKARKGKFLIFNLGKDIPRRFVINYFRNLANVRLKKAGHNYKVSWSPTKKLFVVKKNRKLRS